MIKLSKPKYTAKIVPIKPRMAKAGNQPLAVLDE